MSKWQVELTGHRFDLKELPRLFTSPDLRVIEQDGRYQLEAADFEGLHESAAVHAVALALLPRVNGVGKLEDGSFRDVEIGTVRAVDEEGRATDSFVFLPGSIEARSKMTATLTVDGQEEPAPPTPGSLDSDAWMRAATADPLAVRALELWGGPHDPAHLWKVWELVRDNSGLTIDTEKRRRFRPALNDRSIAGDDARHEVPMRNYPVEPDTMSLPEVDAFLGGLLKEWLGAG